MSLPEKELVEELKVFWRRLWNERLDDKVRAEGIAADEYERLFVEKGTVIKATRDYKALSFREILLANQVLNADRFVPVSPAIGGWGKFVRANITGQRVQRHRRAAAYCVEKRERQQPKKGGRGWLHK